jgi:phage baseplate assembly protein W
MYSYESMRKKYGTKVSQTIDSPIMVFDYFEIVELFAALLILLIFGVVFY